MTDWLSGAWAVAVRVHATTLHYIILALALFISSPNRYPRRARIARFIPSKHIRKMDPEGRRRNSHRFSEYLFREYRRGEHLASVREFR
jgi:hypothetical protein